MIPHDADPDTAISEAQAVRNALSQLHAIATAHDAYGAAAQVDDVRPTLDMVITRQSWLEHYREGLLLW